MWDYDRGALASSLRRVGLRPGDVVFSHSNVGFLGRPTGGATAENTLVTILGAFFDVIGEEGTLFVPTFTYSAAKGEVFDPKTTPSTCGILTEMVRRHPAAIRSTDPMFSVAGIGARAARMTADASEETFGEEGFFGRFARAGGVVCNLNCDGGSTFIHYVEKRLDVPYRYDKVFEGFVRRENGEQLRRQIHFAHDLTRPELVADFQAFDALARSYGVLRTASVGRGAVVAVSAVDTERLIAETLRHRPWFLTKAEKTGVTPCLEPKIGRESVAVPPIDGGMSVDDLANQLQAALAPIDRSLLGPEMDAAFEILAKVVPLQLRYVPTGTWIGDVLVPERQSSDGRRCFGALPVGEVAIGLGDGDPTAVTCDLSDESAREPALAAALVAKLRAVQFRGRWRLVINPRPFSAARLVEPETPTLTLAEIGGIPLGTNPAKEVLARLVEGIFRRDTNRWTRPPGSRLFVETSSRRPLMASTSYIS